MSQNIREIYNDLKALLVEHKSYQRSGGQNQCGEVFIYLNDSQ